jgi:hypothetical protein
MRTRSVKGVRIALAELFRVQEMNKRMQDKAAHACHALCRPRVVEEIQLAIDNMAEPSESNSLELRSPFTMRYHDIKIGRLTPPSPR